MSEVSKTRKFGGKIYKQHDWYTSKLVASVATKNLRDAGYNVRITVRPKGKSGNYPLYTLYYLWKRKR